MIELHRLGHPQDDAFVLNSDLITMIEAHPDTVLTLTTGAKVVVDESPEEVVARIRAWRVSMARGPLVRARPMPV